MLQPCPDCKHEGRLLPGVSAGARVDYYRCDQCGLVWTTPKGRQAPLERITRKADRESQLRVPRDAPACRSARIRKPRPLGRELARLISLQQALQERIRESRAGVQPVVRLTAQLGEQRNAIREYWARISRKRATCGYFFVVDAPQSLKSRATLT